MVVPAQIPMAPAAVQRFGQTRPDQRGGEEAERRQRHADSDVPIGRSRTGNSSAKDAAQQLVHDKPTA